jgi:hypothetical protein
VDIGTAYLIPEGSKDEERGCSRLGEHGGLVQCCAKASSHMNEVGLTRWMSPGCWIPLICPGAWNRGFMLGRVFRHVLYCD